MFSVRFTPEALSDLEEIKRYISDDLFNPQAATHLIALVFDKVRLLTTTAHTSARLKTDISLLKAYRFIPCKNDLVFYRVEENRVSIIRVLHGRRNYLELLDQDKNAVDEG